MNGQIIDGKNIANTIQDEIRCEVEVLKQKGIIPGLAVIIVGDDPASHSYVKGKVKACDKVGINSITEVLPQGVDEKDVLSLIDKLNNDDRFHGILVQLPLPKHISERKIINAVDPSKDVDGLHPYNMGMLLRGTPTFIPCTPSGVQQMLLRTGHDPNGKHVVIVGRSNIVGKPLLILLSAKQNGGNATVTMCHSRTKDLALHTKEADVLISAVGKPKTITKEMVKPGTVVIDVGVNSIDDSTSKRGYRLVGDVDFDEVKKIAKAITKVPGGVGPMTITMLLHNTVTSAKLKHDIK